MKEDAYSPRPDAQSPTRRADFFNAVTHPQGIMAPTYSRMMIKGFLNIPYFAWAIIALILAVVWVYVWPHNAVTVSDGFRFLAIRWGHAVTWFLLATSFFLRGISPSLNDTANIIALAGGVIYILFMVMTFVVK